MWLKRRHANHIVIGGAAGAHPSGDRLVASPEMSGSELAHPVPDHLLGKKRTPLWALSLILPENMLAAGVRLCRSWLASAETSAQVVSSTKAFLVSNSPRPGHGAFEGAHCMEQQDGGKWSWSDQGV